MLQDIQKKKRGLWTALAAFVVLAGLVFVCHACLADKDHKKAADVAAAADTGKAKGDADKGDEVVDSGWSTRCNNGKKDDKKSCEVYDLLAVKKTNSLLAEMAVGFPEGREKGTARGAVILPLGIALDDGVNMQIDDGKTYAFKVHECTNEGCLSYVNIDKDLLESLKKGTNVNFLFKAATGQPVKLQISLSGFGKTIHALD